jgi:hypothetical protein
MAEITYAGYVPTSRPDYSALSNELAEKIYGVLDKRQERKQKLDQVEVTNQKLLDSWIPGKTQTLNDFMLSGVDNMRKDLLQWNKDLKSGKMSETEYVRRNRNLEESYQMLANVLKSQDERVTTILQRQEPDENGVIHASNYETDYLLKKFGEFTEGIKDKQIKTGSDGRIYIAKVDPQTGLVTNEVMDVRSMALPENLAASRINLPARVEDITQNWATETTWKDLGLKGEINIEGVKTRPEYKYMVERAVNSIAPDSNPKAQISILVDNGEIDNPEYYDTPEQRDAIMQEKIGELMQVRKDSGYKGQAMFPTEEEIKKIELSLINNELTPDGVYMPVLTEEQKELAKNRVRGEIDFSFANKITGTPLQVPTRGTGGVAGSNAGNQPKEDKKPIEKYDQMVSAWRTANFDELNALIDKQYWTIGLGPGGKGYAIYKKGDRSKKVQYMNPDGNLDSGYLKYFFGSSSSSLNEGKRQQDLYRQKNYGGRPPTKTGGSGMGSNQGKGDDIFGG